MTNNNNPLSRYNIPPDKRAAIAALTRVPTVSPAVLGLLIASTGGVIVSDVLAVMGHLGLGWACLINCFLMYWQFTVVHDSIHRSAAKNQKLNDWLGHIGLATFGPQVNLGIFRWAHIQHHRYTNGPKDPDTWMHGAWWTLPMRWVLIDLGYFRFVLQSGDQTAMRHLRGAIRNTVITLLVIAVLTWFGYGKYVVFLWFIPARVTFLLVGFVFFWLPHVKDDVQSEDDLTLATSVRLGGGVAVDAAFSISQLSLDSPSIPHHALVPACESLESPGGGFDEAKLANSTWVRGATGCSPRE